MSSTPAEKRAMLEVLREQSPAAAFAMEQIFGDVLSDDYEPGEEEPVTYRIVRFFKDDPEQNRTIIATGLSLEEAQEHCNDPETSSSSCTNEVGLQRTERYGDWFDGYEQEAHGPITTVDGEMRRIR